MKNDKELISVIMPAYNAGLFISEAISSILNQTFTDFEFIIIDDYSTDDSWDFIQSFSDERMITLRNEKNKGTYPTRNLGIKMSKGKYMAVMDADDIALPDRLKIQYDYLENKPNILAIGAQHESLGMEYKIEKPTSYEEICACLLDNNCILHPSLFVRTDIVKQIGGYDERYIYASDYDLMCRISMLGKIENLPDICMIYRWHPDQITQAKRFEQQRYADEIRQKYQIAFINKFKPPVLHEVGETETGFPDIGRVIGLYVMGACFNPSFLIKANSLLDIITDNLHTSMPLRIKKGLLGFGFGIIYLLRNHLVSGDEDDILEVIDNTINNSVINFQEQLDNNMMCEIGQYLITRITKPKPINTFRQISNQIVLIYIVDIIDTIHFSSLDIKDLYKIGRAHV